MRPLCLLVAAVMIMGACSSQGAPMSTSSTSSGIPGSTTSTGASLSTTSVAPPTGVPPDSPNLITATGKTVPSEIPGGRRYCGFLGDQVYLRQSYDYFDKSHPVIAAVVIGDMDRLARLLEEGADPNDLDETYAVNALSAAIESDCDEAVDLLLDHGADPSLAAPSGTPPLVAAIQRRNYEVMRRLIAEGADVDRVYQSDGWEYLAILEAAAATDLEALQILINADADVNQTAFGGSDSALQAAVANDWMEGVRVLVGAGADTTNVAFYTFENKDPVLLRYLLEHGASPDGPGNFGLYGPCPGAEDLTGCFEKFWPEGAAILHEYGG